MQHYKNIAGNSGVRAYEIGSDFIKIKFISGEVYTYSYAKAGKIHVERMKSLAQKGKGLAGYISRNAKDLYD